MADLGQDKVVLTYDAVTDTWVPKTTTKLGFETMPQAFFIADDYTKGSGAFPVGNGVVGIAGDGGGFRSAGAIIDKSNHPGVWGMGTGTTSVDGRCFIISGSATTTNVGGGGIVRSGTTLYVEGNLSTALQRYRIGVGLLAMSFGPPAIVEGIGFVYSDNINGGRWQGVCHDGVQSSLDTGITVAANGWYRLEFEVNADGTSVEFFIDGVSVGTITTNIPAGNSFDLFYNSHIMNVIGLLDRTVWNDNYYLYQEVTR